MYASLNRKKECIEILSAYTGDNPLILKFKRDIILMSKIDKLNDFACEYILLNHNRNKIQINKTVPVADWYGEELMNKYDIEFIPRKILIITYVGEIKTAFHLLVKWRKNMNPIDIFVSKKAILSNFLLDDYHKISVDFDRYDNLSMTKNPERKLKPHQKEAVQFLLSRRKCILADSMGTGKSTSLSVAAIEGNFDSVLIICPASVKTTWKKELMWYVPEKDITIINSHASRTKTELEEFLGYRRGGSNLSVEALREEAKEKGKWQDNRFVIVNFDILDEFDKIPSSRKASAVESAYENSPMLRYIKGRKSLIIIDEAHRLSNSTSMRYKIVKHLINVGKPDSVYLATGTPVTNNPLNLYCLLALTGDPIADDYIYYTDRYCGAMMIPAKGEKEKWTGIFLSNKRKSGRNVQSYYDLTMAERNELKSFIGTNAKRIRIMKEATNLDELRMRVSHIYLRRTKEDLEGGLPPKTVHEVFYEFNDIQSREYNDLWDEYEAAQLELDPDKEINKDLLEGAIYRRYCSNQMTPHTIEMADKFIEKGEKVIIVTCYDEELNILREYYRDKCVVYNGKMNSRQKDAAQSEFTNNPDIKVFIGQIIAAGVGLTLISARIMIFNNMSFVPGDNRQMEDRIYRIGQTRPVDVYYQMFKDTQYEKMWNIVLRKELLIDQVIKKEDEK